MENLIVIYETARDRIELLKYYKYLGYRISKSNSDSELPIRGVFYVNFLYNPITVYTHKTSNLINLDSKARKIGASDFLNEIEKNNPGYKDYADHNSIEFALYKLDYLIKRKEDEKGV